MLLILDAGLFILAFSLSALTSSQSSNIQMSDLTVFSNIVIFIFILQVTYLSLGLYKSKLRDKYMGIFRRLVLATAIGFLFISFLQQLIQNQLFVNEILFPACIYAFVFTLSLRFFLYKFNILGFAKRNVLVLGAGQRALIIENRMRRDVDREGFNLIGFVHMDGDIEAGINSEHVIYLNTGLMDFVVDNFIHEIVVATDERRSNLPVDELFACKIRGVVVSEILDFFEKETGQIAVNLIYPSWVIYSQGFSSHNELRNTFDWLFNACLSAILFLLTWPIMLLTIIAIKLEDGWSSPCFYFQSRVGINGKLFKIVKFRSMVLNAENGEAKWATVTDDRITRVGRFIRKYRIDELPQVYNVITGDMGFVGPRPERPEFVTQLVQKIPYYNERHNVKSGLTGWAQLKYPYGANDEDAQEKLKYDLYYIKHRSFLLDILILIQTAEIVLFGKGR